MVGIAALHPSYEMHFQIIPASRIITPAAHDPASTHSIPILRRKIAVAAAIASTKAAISRLPHTGMSNDRPNERTGVVCRNSVCNREPDREVQDHADDRRGDRRQRAGERLVAAQRLDVGRAEEDPEEAGRRR